MHLDYGDNAVDVSTFLDPYWDNYQEGGGGGGSKIPMITMPVTVIIMT